ncbi:hypothetical protein JNUCC64_25540 [Streptomyces sp. JNUCC 64]
MTPSPSDPVVPHALVMDLLRAALDPESHREDTRSPLDLPTGRLLSDAARADAAEKGMRRLSLIASGLAMAATGLTLELAARSQRNPEELLESLERTARQLGDGPAAPVADVVNGMLRDRGEDGMRVLGETFARDQVDFLDLLIELAHYCGTSILALDRTYGTPRDQTLEDLEEMLRASEEEEPETAGSGAGAGPEASRASV